MQTVFRLIDEQKWPAVSSYAIEAAGLQWLLQNLASSSQMKSKVISDISAIAF
jgi:hypothetical protein